MIRGEGYFSLSTLLLLGVGFYLLDQWSKANAGTVTPYVGPGIDPQTGQSGVVGPYPIPVDVPVPEIEY